MPITNINETPQLIHPPQSKQTDAVYDQAQAKKEQNSAIVRSQMDVSLKMGNEPMALLYKTALAAINEALDPTQESKPIQTAYDNQVDVSPEATATRIVSLATGFFPAFQQQNTDIAPEESLDKFMAIISGGIETGFKDARDILESLSVLDGKIATDIDSTYDLVQEGLKHFTDSFFNDDESANNEE
ncbi:DUF5610 domain-containing protein [Candidatus Colwellia aromaticivorans]|uniref:DUF5610 domain-containing protein n=1 Tax=Candidatus Colwellia aromaticivorans TaxID=2267621 RepID=UPI000DF41901|nr:DUF5610 domain-containing protein [Candidatus Colwellia aromaticivorans]